LGREDADVRRDDVPREVGDEQDVALGNVVVNNDNEALEVGAGEDGDLLPCAIEVGGESVFVAPLRVGEVDVAKCGRAGGGGDAEHHMVVGLGALGRGGIAGGVLEVRVGLVARRARATT
jgi:hypothetical protein